MLCPIRPLPFKPPRLLGLSEHMTVNHYENHYGTALRRLNEIDAELASLDKRAADSTRLHVLKAEHLKQVNAVQLHEIYFDSLGGEDGLGGEPPIGPSGKLSTALREHFVSVDNWRQEFTAMATSLASESGWVILQWNTRLQRLENYSVSDESTGVIGGVPLLALDLHKHAYADDFGTDASAFIKAFFTNLRWGRAATRFNSVGDGHPAVSSDDNTINPEELRKKIDAGSQPFLLDVCLLDDLPKRHDRLPTAKCCKSDELAQAMPNLPKDRPIVAYCIYGFQVSGNAAEELRNAGFDAKALSGGISAWRAIGESTVPYKL